MLVTEELTSDCIVSEVIRQRHAFVTKQMPALWAMNFLAGSLLFGLQLDYSITAKAISWYSALSASLFIQLLVWIRYRDRQVSAETFGQIFNRFAISSFATGCIWGVAPFSIALDGSPQVYLFVAIVMTGMAAGTYSLISPLPKIVTAFIYPCMSPMILYSLINGESAAHALATLDIALLYVMTMGASSSEKFFNKMFQYASEASLARTQLVEALDCSDDAIVIFDREGGLLKANGAFRTQFKDVLNYSQMPADGAYYDERSGKWSIGKSNKTSDNGMVVIHTDIADLKNAERESQRARMKAEEANRAKTHFLAAVSHELRTPLNAVIGYSDLLRRQSLGALGAPEYKDYSDKISDSGRRLLKQVNDIIDLTKFESSTYPLDSTRVSVAHVIEIVIEIARRSTRDKRDIAVSIDDDAQFLFADENAFKTALEHVLRKALKYTSSVDEIGIKATIVDGGPCIQMRDAGDGIPLEYLAHVTEPFLQAQSNYDRKHEGLGLGLAVAQSIMRAHGGSLEIESVEGAGTFVDLRFPADRLVSGSELQQLKVGT